MCIAIVKPQNIDFPSKKILQCCFKNNPDGSGFSFNRSGYNYIYKGFFTFNDFWKAFKSCNLTKDDIIFIHFRLTSNGLTIPEMCHPFPITQRIGQLRSLYLKTKNRILIHNGTFKDLIDSNKNITDTMNFCIEMSNFKNIKSLNLLNLNFEENRLAILENDGEFQIFGNWINVNGTFFSNRRFNVWNDDSIIINNSYKYGSLDHNVKNELVGFDGEKILSKKIFICEKCKKTFQYNNNDCIEYFDAYKLNHKLCNDCSIKYNINRTFICKNCKTIKINKLNDGLCNKCLENNTKRINRNTIERIKSSLIPEKTTCICKYCKKSFSNEKFICIVKNDLGEDVCISCYKNFELNKV